MTQFSFGWILSLNWLCQKWGQVHKAEMGKIVERLRERLAEISQSELPLKEDPPGDDDK
jgi:hypothetical protein